MNPLISTTVESPDNFRGRMISILTTLSNFSCVISILTTLSKYTCIFESILQLLGKIFQTDTFKIFELIAVIFFAFLNVIGSKNRGIVFIAILQCLLMEPNLFFRSLAMTPLCYEYIVLRCISLVFGGILCCCRGTCDLRWELIEKHEYQPTQLHATCFKNAPVLHEDNEIEVPPLP